MKLVILALLLSAYIPSQAQSEVGLEACATYLTDGQLQILKSASESSQHFTWSVHSANIQGKTRAVVLLGERHVKFERDSQLGKEILSQFPAYGLEGLDLQKTWLGQLLGAPLQGIRQSLRLYDRWTGKFPDKVSVERLPSGATMVTIPGLSSPPRSKKTGLFGKLARFIFYGRGNHGSTIKDASLRGRSRQLRYLARLQEVSAALDLENMPLAEGLALRIRVGDQVLSGWDFLREMDRVKQQALSSPLDINLEDGHNFSLVENLGSLLLPSTLIACTYQLGGSTMLVGEAISHGAPFVDPYSAEAMEAVTTAGGVLAGLLMAFAGDRFLGKFDWGGQALNWTMDRILGHGRNQTMAKNVHRVFVENPELEVLLAIAGKAHVPGIASQLEATYGFELVASSGEQPAQR